MWKEVKSYHTWPKHGTENGIKGDSLAPKDMNEEVSRNMAVMTPPCTILLRIKGGFERISDAAVIENGDHLFYEQPVGSIVVLEETSHKVLYIMNKDWQLEPSFLLRKMENFPAITDLTARILYLENTWSGLTYRTDGTAVFAFGFGSGNMHFSYSYDHTFTGIQQHTYGTHEIGIAFRIETLASKRHIGFWDY